MSSSTTAITLNGGLKTIPIGMTISTLLEHLAIDPERVAIELNGKIVRRTTWPSTPIGEGAQLEVVQFVGGG